MVNYKRKGGMCNDQFSMLSWRVQLIFNVQ